MAKYVVYVNADQLGLKTEQFVSKALAQCGFERAMDRQLCSVPVATLLFVGESSFEEIKLARHLERVIKAATLREIDVLVFRLDKLRLRHAVIARPAPLLRCRNISLKPKLRPACFEEVHESPKTTTPVHAAGDMSGPHMPSI